MSKSTKTNKASDRKDKKKDKKNVAIWKFPYNKTDIIWMLIGVVVVGLGYVLMATGLSDEPALEQGTWNNVLAVDVAPIVLLLGYAVIIPMALFKFFSRSKSFNKDNDNAVNEQ